MRTEYTYTVTDGEAELEVRALSLSEEKARAIARTVGALRLKIDRDLVMVKEEERV